MQYQIKSLSLGEVLDQSIQLLKNHFGLFFGIVAVAYLPCTLVIGFVVSSNMPEVPVTPTEEDIRVLAEASSQLFMYVIPLTILLGFIILPITNAAIIDAVSGCYLTKEATIGSSFGRAMKVLLPLLGTWLLQMLAIMGGLVLLIIPGIIFMCWFALATHAVVIGGESGASALSRSKKLMKGNIGNLIALGMVLGVIQKGTELVGAIIPQPQIAVLVQSFLGAIAMVFSAIAFVVFYFSCRCKNENFDLELLAENVGLDDPEELEPSF